MSGRSCLRICTLLQQRLLNFEVFFFSSKLRAYLWSAIIWGTGMSQCLIANFSVSHYSFQGYAKVCGVIFLYTECISLTRAAWLSLRTRASEKGHISAQLLRGDGVCFSYGFSSRTWTANQTVSSGSWVSSLAFSQSGQEKESESRLGRRETLKREGWKRSVSVLSHCVIFLSKIAA